MAISSGEQWRMVVGLFAVAASRKGRCAPYLREGTGCCQWFSLCRSESDPTIQIHAEVSGHLTAVLLKTKVLL